MNAHINHDLALALLVTESSWPSFQHPSARAHRLSISKHASPNDHARRSQHARNRHPGVIAEDTGKIGRFWPLEHRLQARDLAWTCKSASPTYRLARDAALVRRTRSPERSVVRYLAISKSVFHLLALHSTLRAYPASPHGVHDETLCTLPYLGPLGSLFRRSCARHAH